MNLGEIRADVFYRLSMADGDTEDDAFAERRINEEYRRLVSELGTYIKSADLTFVQDDPDVDLPADVLRTLTIYRSGYATPLIRVAPEWIAAAQAEASTQTSTDASGPTHYSENGVSKIIVYPTPETGSATGATCRYVAAPTALSADVDIPSHLPLSYHDVLIERVVAAVALAEEEQGLAQVAAGREAQLTAAIERDVARRHGGDRFQRQRGLPPARSERMR